MSRKKYLKLGSSIIAPRAANGGWRHPLSGSYIQRPLEYFTTVIQTAEKGKLDFVFLPDFYNVFANSPNEFEKNINVWLEPVTLLAAMASVTKNIGLGVTLSTTFNEPYHVARYMASLDHLSSGRACWNVVTSRGDVEGVNFKSDNKVTIEERDEHSTLFLQLVKELWDSWEQDAIVENKETGVFAIPEKIHQVVHNSKWFSINAPLNVAHPPQGYPVLMQSGKSEAFRERVVKTSDVIFTQLNNIDIAKAYYKDVKERAIKNSVNPDHILIMPGIQILVAETEEKLKEKKKDYEQFDDIMSRNDRIALFMHLDMREYTLDMPLPEHSNMGEEEKYQQLLSIAKEKNFKTIRELAMHLEEMMSHLTVEGTPSQIADILREWLEGEAADGFIFLPHLLPASLDDVVELLIPELQKQGLFRQEYEGSTLRENLGLAFPLNSLPKKQNEK